MDTINSFQTILSLFYCEAAEISTALMRIQFLGSNWVYDQFSWNAQYVHESAVRPSIPWHRIGLEYDIQIVW